MRIRSVLVATMICSLVFAAGCSSQRGKRNPCSKSVVVSPQQATVSIVADSISYDKDASTLTAEGNVKIESGDGSVIMTEKAVIIPAKKQNNK